MASTLLSSTDSHCARKIGSNVGFHKVGTLVFQKDSPLPRGVTGGRCPTYLLSVQGRWGRV
jgi:hypothetical protein